MKWKGIISSYKSEIRTLSGLTTILRCCHCLQHPEGTGWNCSTSVLPGFWHLLLRRRNIHLGCSIPWKHFHYQPQLHVYTNELWISFKWKKMDVVLTQQGEKLWAEKPGGWRFKHSHKACEAIRQWECFLTDTHYWNMDLIIHFHLVPRWIISWFLLILRLCFNYVQYIALNKLENALMSNEQIMIWKEANFNVLPPLKYFKEKQGIGYYGVWQN